MKLDLEDEIIRETLVAHGGRVVHPGCASCSAIEPPSASPPTAPPARPDPPGRRRATATRTRATRTRATRTRATTTISAFARRHTLMGIDQLAACSAAAISRSAAGRGRAWPSHAGPSCRLMAALTVFVLAIFVGFEIITKIPPTLHTPLMSGSNAISGITLVGAILAAGAGPRLGGLHAGLPGRDPGHGQRRRRVSGHQPHAGDVSQEEVASDRRDLDVDKTNAHRPGLPGRGGPVHPRAQGAHPSANRRPRQPARRPGHGRWPSSPRWSTSEIVGYWLIVIGLVIGAVVGAVLALQDPHDGHAADGRPVQRLRRRGLACWWPGPSCRHASPPPSGIDAVRRLRACWPD